MLIGSLRRTHMRLQRYLRVSSDLGNKLLYNSMLASELIILEEYYSCLKASLDTSMAGTGCSMRCASLAPATSNSFKEFGNKRMRGAVRSMVKGIASSTRALCAMCIHQFWSKNWTGIERQMAYLCWTLPFRVSVSKDKSSKWPQECSSLASTQTRPTISLAYWWPKGLNQ